MTAKVEYDRKNPISIYDYSKNIIGHSLFELFGNKVAEGSNKGKGNLGQMVEKFFFGYDNNSNQKADFSEAGMELKCTPLLKYKNDHEWKIKERLVCTIINYKLTVDVPFEKSHFYQKCRLMLFLFYWHIYGEKNINYKFIFRVLWLLPEKDIVIMKHDYEVIVEKIRNGKAHEISEGDTMYLAACRKGQKGDNPQEQPFSEIPAPRRAFCLKPTYMRTILKLVKEYGKNHFSNVNLMYQGHEMTTEKELRQHSFEEIICNRFAPYIGKNYYEICQLLGLKPSKAKHKYAIVANAIMSKTINNADNSDEFRKSGIRLKTIRIDEHSTPKESMSFENINYEEVYDCSNWYESRLYEIFTGRFLFVIFKRTKRGDTKSDDVYQLSKVFFWTIPQTDLKVAQEYWQNIRKNVLDNTIFLQNFWAIRDKRFFHVRPKGVKGSYKNAAHTHFNTMADKYCYWFNASYVKKIITTENI